jgi:DNA-binding NarL/FixJ family response regulator
VIRVLIVAAYASARAGLHALLAEAEDCTVIGQVSGSAELERVLPEARPDVVLVDENEADGPALLEIIAGSEAGLVLLGEDRAGYRVLAGLPLHGWAYLRKVADGPEIAGAVRAVAAGLVALDPSMAPLLAASPAARRGEAPNSLPPSGPEPLSGEALTPREREVLQLMALGLPNKSIGTRLSISTHTVKFHVASVLAKLGATSRTEAVTLGVRLGYIAL